MHKNNAYWDGEDGPFCIKCFDDERRLIRINFTFPSDDFASCPKCKNQFNITGKDREDKIVKWGRPRPNYS